MITRNYLGQRFDAGLTADPESKRYKTRAFITQGRFHLLLFTVNNLDFAERQLLNLRASRRYLKMEPFEAFKEGKNVLSVFLETNSLTLNFQVMDQSKNTSDETSMVVTILRCFRDMVAVMYKIGATKTVIVYQMYQEEYGEVQTTFEERNFVPDEELDLEEAGRRRTRFRLRKIVEVEKQVVEGSALHDMFFLERDTLCLMLNSDMIIWKNWPSTQKEALSPALRGST